MKISDFNIGAKLGSMRRTFGSRRSLLSQQRPFRSNANHHKLNQQTIHWKNCLSICSQVMSSRIIEKTDFISIIDLKFFFISEKINVDD